MYVQYSDALNVLAICSQATVRSGRADFGQVLLRGNSNGCTIQSGTRYSWIGVEEPYWKLGNSAVTPGSHMIARLDSMLYK